MFVSDMQFSLWEQPFYRQNPDNKQKSVYDPKHGTMPRYPKVVLSKLKAMRDAQVDAAAPKKSGVANLKLQLKPTTQAALNRRGVSTFGDLRLATDEVLDQVIDELLFNKTPPLQINWAHLEETVQDMKTFGRPMPKMRSLNCLGISAAARERLRRINDYQVNYYQGRFG